MYSLHCIQQSVALTNLILNAALLGPLRLSRRDKTKGIAKKVIRNRVKNYTKQKKETHIVCSTMHTKDVEIVARVIINEKDHLSSAR